MSLFKFPNTLTFSFLKDTVNVGHTSRIRNVDGIQALLAACALKGASELSEIIPIS